VHLASETFVAVIDVYRKM